MKAEMDFHLIIGPLFGQEVEYGRYSAIASIIAVDRWTGEETEEFMADVLSHEYLHHLLGIKFGYSVCFALDNFRRLTDHEMALCKDGVDWAWSFLSSVARFTLKVAGLSDDPMTGNGVI